MKFFYDIFNQFLDNTAIIYKDHSISYRDLVTSIHKWKSELNSREIYPGEVIALHGDFTFETIAILFALIENKNIIVPFNNRQITSNHQKTDIAGVNNTITIDDDANVIFGSYKSTTTYPLYRQLRSIHHPGLVLFTSGTSGEPKAAVHDFTKLLEKFKTRKKTFRTLNFLLFDHWGGLNTMFHTLSNGGTVLVLKDRDPKSVCEFIEKYKIELLPVSPTFLNLLLISEEYKNYDLSSLKVITYGTEPMPQSTLERVKSVFLDVKLQQTYGLIELGVLRSKSKDDSSLWVKIGGEGFETRVVDGLLEIKAESAMLGYLNAPSPFTEDGWFKTGDQVEVDGEYIKILGRKSEIINVGGLKVYPAEVESVIQELDNVAEVTVYGEKNAIVGNIVCVKIRLLKEENNLEFNLRLRHYCKQKLQAFQIPIKIIISDEQQYNERFKKKRV